MPAAFDHARWIADPRAKTPAVTAFRRIFSLPGNAKIRAHISADERYEFFVDGERIGCGPERCDLANWSYESHDLDLKAGRHVIVARTWHLGELAPKSQMSVRPGFLFVATGVAPDLLNTGVAGWESMPVDGYGWLEVPETQVRGYYTVGARCSIDGRRYPWGIERGEGALWQASVIVADATWTMSPAQLPAMHDEPRAIGRIVHIDAHLDGTAVLRANHLASDESPWNGLLLTAKPLTIPAGSRRRVIIDLENYFCGYSDAVLTGGADASVRINWSESLFEKPEGPAKGDRDLIEGKFTAGCGDLFITDGGEERHFRPLWWQAGRYLEVQVATASKPLTIRALGIRETRYPHRFTATFASDDPRLAAVIPMALRTLEMCSHDSYMDCPHYEQQMWIGDTRLQALVTYVQSDDDRLPRKALALLGSSRNETGLTACSWPGRGKWACIPGFSLWWVAMVHDYALWRGDDAFVRSLLPGTRAVFDGVMKTLTPGHLLSAPPHWNYQDWVPGWDWGIPKDGAKGICGLINWQLAWVLMQGAELEEQFGDAAIAQRYRQTSADITKASIAAFWDEGRGLFAEDLGKTKFDEHSQCLALLGNQLPTEMREQVATGLVNDRNLDRTTIYFTHYLFEAYRLLDRTDLLIERMQLWFDHHKNGLKTTIEQPEPSRSDCHAWGAHPVFHYFATILGIRPASPGFAEVRIEPRLGPLNRAEGRMPHPKGVIEVSLRIEGGELAGDVETPVAGVLAWGGMEMSIKPGKQSLKMAGKRARAK
jgi:hypothetical protein